MMLTLPRRTACVLAAVLTVPLPGLATPTAVTWDTDPTTAGVQDGGGIWDTQSPNFYDPVAGTNNTFDNTANHDVTFGGNTGGLVTLGTGVTARSLTFNPAAGSYTIAASTGSALTLATNSPTLTTNTDVAISAPIVIPYPTQPPVIFTKNGAGRLTLSGTNSWDGGRTWFEVNAGSVWVTSPAALPGYTSMYSTRVNGTAGLYVPVGGDSAWTDAALGSLAFRTQISGNSVFGIDTTAGDFTYTGGLSGGRNTKIGPNTLTLTGGGGTFVVAEGAAVVSPRPKAYVSFSSVEVLPNTTLTVQSGGTVSMAKVGMSSGSTLTVNGYASLGTTTIPANATVAINADARLTNVSLAPGGTLTITPGATAQLADPNGSGVAPAVLTTTTPGSTVAITGGGALSTKGPLTFGPVSGVTYDLTALSAFSLVSGYTTTFNGNNTAIKLPAVTSFYAGTLNVGRGTTVQGEVHAPILLLGKTTLFDVGGLQIGVVGDAGSGGADGIVKLPPSTADATVIIRSSTGSSGRVYLNVGSGNSPTRSQSATLDMRDATLDATVARMILGSYSPYNNFGGPVTGSQTSTFAMSNGIFDASEIVVGASIMPSPAAGTSAGTNIATFTQEGGTVRAGTLTLGLFTNYNGSRNPSGNLAATYDLGTTTSAGTLAAGAISATFSGYSLTTSLTNLATTRTINFKNGHITTATETSDLTITGVTHSAASLMTPSSRNMNIVLAATGTHALTAPAGRSITLTDSTTVTGSGGLLMDGAGTVSLNGSNSYTGGTTVTGGTLNVSPTSRAPLLSGVGTDLRAGRVVFSYATVDDDPSSNIRDMLADSFADHGFANAKTLRSTTADATHGLGYIDNGINAVTVAYTLYGDADLDGGVSINDFNALASHFGQSSGRAWVDGDFDYDGGVSINDFNLLAAGFGQSGPAASGMWAGLLAFAAAHNDLAAFEAVTGVPEPATFSLVAAGFVLGRRRRVAR